MKQKILTIIGTTAIGETRARLRSELNRVLGAILAPFVFKRIEINRCS